MNKPEGNSLIALVTGGTRGIGRAVSLRLAKAGVSTVFVNYLQNDKEAAYTQDLLSKENCHCIPIRANVADPDEIDKLFGRVHTSAMHLDVFIHCAAITAFKPIAEIKPNQWDLTMNTNARGFLLCVQKCAPMMTDGKIVAVSSLGSLRAIPDYGAMGPTKAALESLIRYLAVELTPKGIRVNGVTAGLVETESLTRFPNAERLRAETVRRTPFGRIGTADEIADVVMFLISPSARWICGQTIVVDGGFSLL
jgi:enoyl-[acyl-carrier protein] reductase III